MKRIAITAVALCAAPLLFATVFVLYSWNMKPIQWGQDE